VTDATNYIARRLFDALEAGDVAALKDLYSADAVLWTNTAQRELKAREIAAFVPLLVKKMPDRRYANRCVTPFEGGFVHRHRLTGTRKDGARVAAECCAIVRVENGKVARIDEYVDARQQDAFSG